MRKETTAALVLTNFTINELLSALALKLTETLCRFFAEQKTHFMASVAWLRNSMKPRLSRFTELCSWIAGQPLTVGESLRIFHVGIALVCLIFPIEMSVALRATFLVWLALTLWRCRQIA